ncbi:MAG: M56 family metallopeptidase [Lachnospiraceae bacterium]|nr:M56 family metallopeptidase [Lachnospiraceae bacterium]
MQITLFSLLMSVIWSSVLAAFNYCCRKKKFFIRQLGMTNLLFLYLFSIVRMLVPYTFSFTRVIPSQGVINDFYKSACMDKIGVTQFSLISVLSVIWMGVSTALILKFLFQYRKAVAEVSSCPICEDEQCRRVFHRVLNQSRTELRIAIRRSGNIHVPMGVGIFKKSILLPRQAYSDSELYYILRHEYTHFQNRDLMIKLFMHIYWCIFWWNPVIWFLKRDLSQILEIKCDLDVTERMKNQDKAGYLTAIVKILKQTGAKRQEKAFCGSTALVAGNYESEVIERFRIVSAVDGRKRKNALFTGTWFLIFGILVFLSYSFVIQPECEISRSRIAAGQETPEAAAGNPYRIKCIDGMYHVYFHK